MGCYKRQLFSSVDGHPFQRWLLGWIQIDSHMQRKCRLTLIFAILSTIFLIVQMVIYRFFSDFVQKYDISLYRRDDTQAALRHDVRTAPLAIRQFMDVAHQHGFPVFLVDPDILKSLSSQHVACVKCCQHLCTNQTMTEFGVLVQLFQLNNEAIDDFTSSNFEITTFFDVNNVSTHVFFEHASNHVIHLIFFHQRGPYYFWHGEFQDDHQTLRSGIQNEIQIVKHEGYFSSFVMIKVVIDGVRMRLPSDSSSFLEQISESRFISCNTSQSDLFFSKYGKPSNQSDALYFWQNAKSILTTATGVLNKLHVPFWLSSGTCLGWFRQCDLISYSKDVDIGIWIKNYNPTMIDAMETAGLNLVHLFGRVNDSYELSFSDGEIKLDVFFFYEERNYMWNGGTQARTGQKYKYIFPKFTMCWTEFLGLVVHVPCETEQYVEANYGPNWFVPVKKWDWKKSPPNVRANGKWSEDERKNVVQLFG